MNVKKPSFFVRNNRQCLGNMKLREVFYQNFLFENVLLDKKYQTVAHF